MHLNQDALSAAYAAAPVEQRDMNLIASVIRAYIDAANDARDAEIIAEMQAVATGEYEGYDETLDPWTADNRSTIDNWQNRLSAARPHLKDCTHEQNSP